MARKIKFDYDHPMIKIHAVITGTDEEIVIALRNYVASKVPNIPIVKVDDEFRERLDVDGKGDWTPEQFYAELTKLWNEDGKVNAKKNKTVFVPIVAPKTAAQFIEVCKQVGVAKELPV